MRYTTLCYLENPAGEYLMLHRVKKKGDLNHDKWIGVGGKFERFESPEDCLLREVKEETGLTLTHWRSRGLLTFIWGNMTEFIHLYTADAHPFVVVVVVLLLHAVEHQVGVVPLQIAQRRAEDRVFRIHKGPKIHFTFPFF